MESVDDIIQSSAPLPGPTPDLCLEAQEEDWQAASAPSERLKLFHHMISNEKNYYVYLPEVDVMYKAGSTLEEVFQGSKEYKDHSIPDDGSWEYEEGPGWTGEGHYRHFQMWATATDSSREWEPAWEVEPFISPDAS